MKPILKNKWVIALLMLLTGIVVGRFTGQSGSENKETSEHQHTAETTETVWTCSMHPTVRQNEPGKCPICGMDLIPVDEVGDDPLNLKMSEEAVRLANIQTSMVELTDPEKEIFMQGKVQVDERRISIITSRFAGRIEQLYVDFTGVEVKKGQKLASIYSPELNTAQQELFEAIKFKGTNPLLYNAARNKLKLWNITEEQINAIEKGGEPKKVIDVLAPLSGVVTKRMATLGDYVKEGTKLFEVVDLSKVWVVFDAYESDIPWIKPGDKINFKVSSLSGVSFDEKVDFIDPLVDPATRTASVRIDFSNTNGKVKPGMFVEGRVSARLPIREAQIIVPKSAVMWTGKRSVVYTKVPDMEHPVFQFKEIITGLDLGTHYIVVRGLQSGEEVVTNGAFKVDAAAQLAGKSSMMNQQSGEFMGVYDVPMEFKHSLTLFYHGYIELKNALIDTDLEKARLKGEILAQKRDKLSGKKLHDEALDLWNEKNKVMQQALENMKNTKDIEAYRAEFKLLSESFSALVEAFGLHGVVIYKDYCPMAVNDKGAIWLSEVEDIRNPYFGDKMLQCGEVKKVIK